MPYAFLRLAVEINGNIYEGYSADNLPPKWFTKIPEAPLGGEMAEMLRVIEHAGKPPSVCRQTLPLICGWTFTKQSAWATAKILRRF